MTSFSALLSSFVEQKHIQIHPLTLYCNVDRSTMYKYINGKRLPPRQELVERIADYMHLSPSEHEELITAWMFAQVGEEAYYNRKNVENFILNFPDVSKIDPVIISSSAGTPDRGVTADCQALASQTAVNSAVGRRLVLAVEVLLGVAVVPAHDGHSMVSRLRLIGVVRPRVGIHVGVFGNLARHRFVRAERNRQGAALVDLLLHGGRRELVIHVVAVLVEGRRRGQDERLLERSRRLGAQFLGQCQVP